VAIGVSLYPTDGATASDVLRNAHAAMSTAKCEENSCWRFFTSELDSELRSQIQAESKLRHALENGEFSLCYHPLIDIRTGEITAAEALLRWHNTDLGHVRPDFFIPIAEETGLIVPIGEWVVEQVCRDMAEWRDTGLPPLRIAVNVSSRQLTDCSLLEVIGDALAANGLGPDRLELEVTERLLLDRSSKTLALLGQFRDAGLRFSIDDFGTGYSSMSYLTAFPFDVLKIDRSFISKVTERSQDAALTQAIIAMAKSIQMEIVAEGVETEEQLDFLRMSGCTFAQGYLFAKPMESARFAGLLRGQRGPVTAALRHPTPN
jgi:EAL domain-containing protein (putative c-di-GMP-specific phosphodiesterase class I)